MSIPNDIEPGTLDINLVEALHQYCMEHSGMYPLAYKWKLVGLLANLQGKYLDDFLAYRKQRFREIKLNEAEANAIYDVLIDVAGAPDSKHGSGRDMFVRCQVEEECREYRFQGKLGYGGKFRNWDGRRWYVDAYEEDVNSERRAIIDSVNERLAQLRKKFRG